MSLAATTTSPPISNGKDSWFPSYIKVLANSYVPAAQVPELPVIVTSKFQPLPAGGNIENATPAVLQSAPPAAVIKRSSALALVIAS